MFPIGWMYYFGTNLENRFAVPDFWPEPGSTHKIPFEKDELKELGDKLREQRLERKRRRLEREAVGENEMDEMSGEGRGGVVEEVKRVEEGQREQVEGDVASTSGKYGFGAIERWARGK